MYPKHLPWRRYLTQANAETVLRRALDCAEWDAKRKGFAGAPLKKQSSPRNPNFGGGSQFSDPTKGKYKAKCKARITLAPVRSFDEK